MNKIKLSLIVPIYNAEKYLEECIESIIEYKKSDLEIILIDDGSSDKSYSICEKFQKQDDRIILLRQKNSGVSRARNLGLSVAKGKYIGFVDSDDVLDSNWFFLIKKLEGKDIYYFSNVLPSTKCKEQMIKYIVGYNQNNICFAGPFSKFFKKELLNKNNISFSENLINGEDMLFNLNCLINCNSFEIINKSFYNYRNFIGSATKKFDKRIFESDLYFQKELQNLNIEKKLKMELICYNAQMAIYVFFQRISYVKSCKERKKYYNFLTIEPYLSSLKIKRYVNKKYYFILVLARMKLYFLIYYLFKFFRKKKNSNKVSFYFNKI